MVWTRPQLIYLDTDDRRISGNTEWTEAFYTIPMVMLSTTTPEIELRGFKNWDEIYFMY